MILSAETTYAQEFADLLKKTAVSQNRLPTNRSLQDQLPLLPSESNGRSVASKVDDGKGGQGRLKMASVEDGEFQCEL